MTLRGPISLQSQPCANPYLRIRRDTMSSLRLAAFGFRSGGPGLQPYELPARCKMSKKSPSGTTGYMMSQWSHANCCNLGGWWNLTWEIEKEADPSSEPTS